MALDRTWYNTLANDDGTNTVGTLWDKNSVDALMDATDAEIVRLDAADAARDLKHSVTTSTVTGAQNNWAPTLSGDTLVKWSGASDAAFTGLAGGATGQVVTVKNTGTAVATFAHNSGSSSAGNKFKNLATSAPMPIAAGGYISYQYDGTDWQLVSHDQGAWITPTFAAGNFTGNNAMTFTVTSGQVAAYRYLVRVKTMHLAYEVGFSTVGGTPSTALQVAIPGGFTAAAQTGGSGPLVNNNVAGQGYWRVLGAGTVVQHFLDRLAATNWTASANTIITANPTFEVT